MPLVNHLAGLERPPLHLLQLTIPNRLVLLPMLLVLLFQLALGLLRQIQDRLLHQHPIFVSPKVQARLRITRITHRRLVDPVPVLHPSPPPPIIHTPIRSRVRPLPILHIVLPLSLEPIPVGPHEHPATLDMLPPPFPRVRRPVVEQYRPLHLIAETAETAALVRRQRGRHGHRTTRLGAQRRLCALKRVIVQRTLPRQRIRVPYLGLVPHILPVLWHHLLARRIRLFHKRYRRRRALVQRRRRRRRAGVCHPPRKEPGHPARRDQRRRRGGPGGEAGSGRGAIVTREV